MDKNVLRSISMMRNGQKCFVRVMCIVHYLWDEEEDQDTYNPFVCIFIKLPLLNNLTSVSFLQKVANVEGIFITLLRVTFPTVTRNRCFQLPTNNSKLEIVVSFSSEPAVT